MRVSLTVQLGLPVRNWGSGPVRYRFYPFCADFEQRTPLPVFADTISSCSTQRSRLNLCQVSGQKSQVVGHHAETDIGLERFPAFPQTALQAVAAQQRRQVAFHAATPSQKFLEPGRCLQTLSQLAQPTRFGKGHLLKPFFFGDALVVTTKVASLSGQLSRRLAKQCKVIVQRSTQDFVVSRIALKNFVAQHQPRAACTKIDLVSKLRLAIAFAPANNVGVGLDNRTPAVVSRSRFSTPARQ